MGKWWNTSMNKGHRLSWIVYIVIGIAVIWLSMMSFFRGTTEWISESYGTTTDGKMTIREDGSYRVSFTIQHDDFEGIYVKLPPTEDTYGEEQIVFTLIDNQSGEQIDRYQIAVSDLVCLVENFIPLHCEKSKNKEVSLYISGEHLLRNPMLSISKNKAYDTELYVDGELQKDRYLVFSAVYRKDSKYHAQAAVNGMVILLFLFFSFYWYKRFLRNKQGLETRKEGYIWKKRIITKISVARMLVFFILLSILYACLMIYTYINVKRNALSKERRVVVAKEDNNNDEVIRINDNTSQVSFSFFSEYPALSSLSLSASASNCDNEAMLQVLVYDETYGVCYHDELISVKDIPARKGKWDVFLEKELSESKNEYIRIVIKPINFSRTEVVLYTGMSDSDIYVSVDGKLTNLSPVLSVCYAKNVYLKTLFLLFAILTYGFLVVAYLLLGVWGLSPQKVFLPLTIYLGVLYMLVIPVYSVPDEYTHIDSAYSISNRLLGIAKPEGMPGYDYKRVEDVENEEYLTYEAERSDYRRLYTDLFRSAKDTSLVLTMCRDATSNAGIIYYLPAAVGLTIGRLLSLNTLTIFMLGRFCNLVTVLLLCYYAVCKLPGMKWMCLVYGATPIALQEAASFSYDAILNAFSILYVALCFSYIKERKHSLIESLLLFFVMFHLATVKGGVYFPICLLIMVVPLERKWRIRSTVAFTGAITTLVIAAFLQNNIIKLLHNYFMPQSASVAPFSGGTLFTVGYMRGHLLRTINVVVTTVFSETSRLIYEFFGGKMASLDQIQMPWLYILVFIGLFAAVGRRDHSGSIIKRHLTVVVITGITLLVISFVALSMLLADTTVSQNAISGLQGRYYIPVMFSTCAALFSRWNQKQNDNCTALLNAVTCYFILQCVFLTNIILLVFG